MASGWYNEPRRHALSAKGIKNAVDGKPLHRAAKKQPQLYAEGRPVFVAWKVDDEYTQVVLQDDPASGHMDVPTKQIVEIRKDLEPFTADLWDEQEVKLALRRLNAGKITPQELSAINKQLSRGEGVTLTKQQQDKGLEWLRKQHRTPTGKIKESTPFGLREIDIIDDPRATISLTDFYSSRGNYYYPVYTACGSRACMDYYVEGGKINIIG